MRPPTNPTTPLQVVSPWRLCVAPMLDWTDRHCRYFHRQLTRHTRLYTEMVTTGALLHGDVARHLAFDPAEQPLALQLGGSEPADLAACARLGERWGYAEINLNCGCPSERVQRGAFGACLMAEPRLVADAVKAMCDAVSVPVTVKHRLGLGADDDHGFVRDFVGAVAEAGAAAVIVHARNAWLQGLSPKDNRDVPPLRYDAVYRLKREFPSLPVVLNGGVVGDDAIAAHLDHVDGVMVGRQAYHDPWSMAGWDQRFFGVDGPASDRDAVEAVMVEHMARRAAEDGDPWSRSARHMLGLRNGQPGARRWRQVWSDHRLKALSAPEVSRRARSMLDVSAVPSAVERGGMGDAVSSCA